MTPTETLPTSTKVTLLVDGYTALRLLAGLPAAKTTCGQCGGTGTVWTRRDDRNVETACGNCGGEGEL